MKTFYVCKPKHQLQPRLVYQACSKTFLHMLEFSWCRGNSEPGTSWSLLLFEENVCPEGSFSCLDTVSLEHTRCKNRLVLFIWHIFLNSITHSLALKSDWWIPEGESGFVHLHADEEGVLRELHGGHEVQGGLCLITYFHSSAYEVCIHCHITDDDQRSPAHNGKDELRKCTEKSRWAHSISSVMRIIFKFSFLLQCSKSFREQQCISVQMFYLY